MACHCTDEYIKWNKNQYFVWIGLYHNKSYYWKTYQIMFSIFWHVPEKPHSRFIHSVLNKVTCVFYVKFKVNECNFQQCTNVSVSLMFTYSMLWSSLLLIFFLVDVLKCCVFCETWCRGYYFLILRSHSRIVYLVVV